MPKITNEEIEATVGKNLPEFMGLLNSSQDQSIGLLDSKAICLLAALRVSDCPPEIYSLWYH